MRRFLGAVLASVAAVVALGLVLVLLLVASGVGGRLVREVGLQRLARAVDGTVRIGTVDGSLWRSLTLRDVEFVDPAGRIVLAATRIEAHYRLLDLVRGRYVLRDVRLARPIVRLEQDTAGRWNVARLFRAGAGPRAARRPVVDLRDAQVTDGSLTIRPASGRRALRFVGVNLDVRRLRAAHPDSAPLVGEVRHVAFRLAEPALRVTRGWGDVVVGGDSVKLALDQLDLPGSALALHGVLHGGGAHPVFAWSVGASRLRFADLAALSPRVPASGGGRLRVQARQAADGVGTVEVRDADLRSGASHVRGGAVVAYDARGVTRVDAVDVTADPLDLALVVPPGGRRAAAPGTVRGRVRGGGPLGALDVIVEAAYLDDALPGRPASLLTGRGGVALGGAHGLAFRRFVVRPADVALATVGRFAPAVGLRGRLRADGVLDGRWRDAGFEGTLAHRDGEGPGTRVRGTARLTLADTVRVTADLEADSLSFDALARSYPALPLRGAVAGRVVVSGPVTALAVETDVAGPGGRLAGRGEIGVGDSAVAVRATVRIERVDVAAHDARLPPTALAGTARADLLVPVRGGTAPATGRLGVTLGPSRVAGVPLDSTGVSLVLDTEAVRVDAAVAFLSGAATASGALGRAGRAPGRLEATVRADSLLQFAPAVRWWRAQTRDTGAALTRLFGEASLTGTVTGTLAEWTAEAKLVAPSVELDASRAAGLEAAATLVRRDAGARLRLAASADSIAVAGFRATAVRASVEGPRDSLGLRVAAGLPMGATVRSTLTAGFGEGVARVRVESLAVSLPGGTWNLVRPARAVVSADSVALDTVALRSSGGGRLVADGTLPGRGLGDFHLRADSVRLADVYVLAQRDTAGVGGWLTVSARLGGSAAVPTLEGYAGLADGRWGDFRTPLVDGLFRYGDSLLTFKGVLWGDTSRVLSVRGALPLDLALTAVARRRLAGPLEIGVLADSVNLVAAERLTPLVSRVAGLLSADVAVRGTWDRPALAGSAHLAGGALTVAALRQRWDGIDLRLELSGDRIRVAEGTIRSGGVLGVGGEVVLEDLARPILHLTLDASGFQALNRRDLAGVRGTGRLRLEGPFIGATLSGALTVDDGYLAFADLVEKRIVNLDDPEFRAVVDTNLARAADVAPSVSNVFLDSLRIDNLRLLMGRSVWLRSSEANIQLAGDFTVSKTPGLLNPYRLDGTLQTVRGAYRLVVEPTSKDFQVTRGEVRFFGTSDLNPQLDIAAEHRVRAVSGTDLVVRARIGGTLREPRLSLESDRRPALSETELVSYLLFGRPTFELGPATAGGRGEQAVLQGAATLLAGRVAGQLEQTLVADLGLPLDYIAIRPGFTANSLIGSTRVEAGTRIGERTFLTVNAGLCTAQRGSATGLLGGSLEYRFTGRWRLEASVEPLEQECRTVGALPRPSQPYQIGVDLFWQRGMQ